MAQYIKSDPDLCSVCYKHGVKMKAIVECDSCLMLYCRACVSEHVPPLHQRHEMKLVSDSENYETADAMECELEKSFHRVHSKHLPSVLLSSLYLNSTKPIAIYYADEFSVALSDDVEKCYVTGCITLADGSFVVADKNNMKIKCFDHNYEETHSVQTDNTIWGLAVLKDDQFATCGNGNIVEIWSVTSGTVTQINQIPVMDEAFGIHCNEEYLCILHSFKNTLTLMSAYSNTVLWRKCYSTTKNIQFGFDLHLDKRYAYVGCAMGDKRVVCISLISKTIMWECPLPGNTCGITFALENILVTDMTNKCIHSVTINGRYNQMVGSLDYMTGRPHYMSYSKRDKVILMSEYGSDKIYLFSPRYQRAK